MGTFSSGFDGVLNSGDSWSKRRPSVNITGPGGGLSARDDDKDEVPRRSDTKEEGIPISDRPRTSPTGTNQQPSSGSPDIPSPGNGSPSALSSDSMVQGLTDMSVGEPNNPNPDQQTSAINPPVTGPPPGLADPASIEWSYLDPQGQEQGQSSCLNTLNMLQRLLQGRSGLMSCKNGSMKVTLLLNYP